MTVIMRMRVHPTAVSRFAFFFFKSLRNKHVQSTQTTRSANPIPEHAALLFFCGGMHRCSYGQMHPPFYCCTWVDEIVVPWVLRNGQAPTVQKQI